jgi:hypothetical protein
LNGSDPSGTVTEVKAGEVTARSQKGNDISKTGDASDPAVHAEREGDDVVKSSSELVAEEKGLGASESNSDPRPRGKEDTKKPSGDVTGKADETKTGEKRKADGHLGAAEEEESGGVAAKEGEVDLKKQKTNDSSVINGAKRGPGRPKSAANSEKRVAPKKEKKTPAIGKAERKTRSQGAA